MEAIDVILIAFICTAEGYIGKWLKEKYGCGDYAIFKIIEDKNPFYENDVLYCQLLRLPNKKEYTLTPDLVISEGIGKVVLVSRDY